MLTNSNTIILFTSYLSIVSAVLVILAPTPIHTVFFGVLFYFFFGWTLIFLGYDFIGILLIMIYAGALMVMFLFVVMAFDLARSVTILPTSFFLTPVTLWSRSAVFLLVLGLGAWLLFNFDMSIGGPNFYSFFICRSRLYYCAVVSSSSFISHSILYDLSLTFYNGFLMSLFLCGIILIVGLIGAVGLTGGLPFKFLKRRRKLDFDRRNQFKGRIIVLY